MENRLHRYGRICSDWAYDVLGYSKSGVIHLTENIKEKVYQNFKTIIELNNSNTENAHSICSRLLYTVLFDIASCIEGNPNNDKGI